MKPEAVRCIATAVVCLGLAACGGSSSDNNSASGSANMDGTGDGTGTGGNGDATANGSGNSAGTSGPAPGTSPGETTTAFNGIWMTNCAQEGTEFIPGSEYQRMTLEVDGSAYKSTIKSYTDSDCSVAAFPSMVESDFSMQFPGGTVSTPQGDASLVDITMETVLIDSVDATIAGQLFNAFDVQYNIMAIGTDGMLYFGIPSPSESARPTGLKTSLPFAKQ